LTPLSITWLTAPGWSLSVAVSQVIVRSSCALPCVEVFDAHQQAAVGVEDFGVARQTLVEAVARKELDVAVDRLGSVGVDAVLLAASNENLLVLLDLGLAFFLPMARRTRSASPGV
jgi:hypothetical protein